MNEQAKKGQNRWLPTGIYAVLGIFLLIQLYVVFVPSQSVRAYTQHRLMVFQRSETHAENFELVRFFRSLPDGDIYIVFDGLDPNNQQDQSFAMERYIRCQYENYWSKVYISSHAAKIVRERDVLLNNDRPALEWFAARKVHTLVLFRKENGRYLAPVAKELKL